MIGNRYVFLDGFPVYASVTLNVFHEKSGFVLIIFLVLVTGTFHPSLCDVLEEALSIHYGGFGS